MDHESALLLDLSGIAPRGERLVDVVRRSLEAGGSRLVIHWDALFPWGVDERLRSPWVYPDQVVDAVARLCEGRGLSIALRSALPECYDGRAEYGHLVRAVSDESSPWRAAAAKLVADLLEDARALMPSLDAIDLPPGAPGANLVRQAARDLGLALHTDSTVAVLATEAPEMGSLEERLARSRHPAAADAPIGALHDELRAWRSRAWSLVGALHERLFERSTAPGVCPERLRAPRRALERHLRSGHALRRRFVACYAGLAEPAVVDRVLARCIAPVREQYGALAARAAATSGGS